MADDAMSTGPAQRALKFLEFDTAVIKGESLIPVAYFNMGAEYEHLSLFP